MANDATNHGSLASYFYNTLLPIHFVHSISFFETAKPKELDIISNSDLRKQLISLYDSQYDGFL
ncbi:MAG TPA: hypothetical protein DEQ87_18115 [Algoriphagus sp.]|nr:hypothetical protein [Algoriphagus sp.]HCB45836.1 hypothetical protein [Algoriphagus sp.]HCD89530.1 hypothetical protein [Algoriphagus sp.]HCX74226.1 hypothetical protein [Algoriphagus sp.]